MSKAPRDEDKEQVRAYYDAVGATFDASYDWDGPLYPSNRIRLDHALDVLADEGAAIQRVLDAGCGTGIALVELLARGYDAWGFDFSAEAITAAKARLSGQAWRAAVGDMEDPAAYGFVGRFDAALVIGAFTHPLDHAAALRSLARVIRPGGLLVVELRNECFDLFTFNEHTLASLRRWLPAGPLADAALAGLAERAYRRPRISDATVVQRAHESFFSVPSVWRNPLTVAAEYAAAGFRAVDTLYFHWHAVPPVFEALDPAAFRATSLALEETPRDWRGLFMASALLLVCRRES